jgi:APA family basic amino acid/polyamine antiporter
MARDGVFFPSVARLHPTFRSPTRAIYLQTGWAVLLVLTGTYAQLVDYVVFADWIFFGLAGASLFVFRARHPVEGRPRAAFRTPGYPILPALFVAVSLLIVVSVLRTNPLRSGLGLLLLTTGIPAYLYWMRKSKTIPPPEPAGASELSPISEREGEP